jgi:hypothetical protein
MVLMLADVDANLWSRLHGIDMLLLNVEFSSTTLNKMITLVYSCKFPAHEAGSQLLDVIYLSAGASGCMSTYLLLSTS